MSPKSLLLLLKRELKDEKVANKIYSQLYNELYSERKVLDKKKSNNYEYKCLKSIIVVDSIIITEEIKTILLSKAIDDNVLLDIIPSYDKTILVMKYIDSLKLVRKIANGES